ncbi:MAG: leucyl aminopeptidase [Neisseriaceae bacterium]
MKCSLLRKQEIPAADGGTHLFLLPHMKYNSTELGKRDFPLPEELASLLQKKKDDPDTFRSTFCKNQALAYLSLENFKHPTTKDRQGLSICYKWLDEQEDTEIFVHLDQLDEEKAEEAIRLLVVGYADANYKFTQFKQNKTSSIESKLTFLYQEVNRFKPLLRETHAIARYLHEAKNLANLPGNICTPKYLADFASTKATQLKVACNIWGKEKIEEVGMHSFLSVAKGSVQPPYFIELTYHGKGPELTAPIVLIGKGITFDSGGISLKPAKGMDEMKYDMCGAASVLATFFLAAELQLPINLVALVPTCENLPSGTANKPGDIVQSLKGLSIEVLNTDAEGRLILCDALTYSEKYQPKFVIDVATLTGACSIALGTVASGILGNNQALLNELIRSSERTNDRVWQLPLWEEYNQELESNFADLANVAESGYAGTITAAAFLSHFIEPNFPWAHIDIAGTAWKKGGSKGATGRPVPLLFDFLKHQSN